MPYLKITQPKLADAIVAELEQMILEGSLQPGQKLPPERELAIQFQVSRPSLREAIQRLEARPTATQCIDCKTLAEIKEKQEMG